MNQCCIASIRAAGCEGSSFGWVSKKCSMLLCMVQLSLAVCFSYSPHRRVYQEKIFSASIHLFRRHFQTRHYVGVGICSPLFSRPSFLFGFSIMDFCSQSEHTSRTDGTCWTRSFCSSLGWTSSLNFWTWMISKVRLPCRAQSLLVTNNYTGHVDIHV